LPGGCGCAPLPVGGPAADALASWGGPLRRRGDVAASRDAAVVWRGAGGRWWGVQPAAAAAAACGAVEAAAEAARRGRRPGAGGGIHGRTVTGVCRPRGSCGEGGVSMGDRI